MPNVAYLLLTHGLPYQTIDLLWSIWREEDCYFVHLDRSSPSIAHAALAAVAAAKHNIHLVPSDICTWGTFSLVEATLRCIHAALAADRTWSHAVLLSGTHVPLKTPAALAQCLEPGRSYMTFHDIDLQALHLDPPNWVTNIARRFVHRHYEVPGLGDIRGGIRRPPAGITFFWGSQWLVLSRQAAELVAQARTTPLGTYLKNTGIPDESYVQTILGNSPLKSQMTHRQIIWQQWGPDGRPSVLLENEYRLALTSKQFFARKASAEAMRDPTGILGQKVATVDRQSWTKSVTAAFANFLPPRQLTLARFQYLEGVSKPAGNSADTEFVTSALFKETADLVRRNALEHGLATQISSTLRNAEESMLTCRFPEAGTKAKYLMVIRFCGLEVAWLGLYVRSIDVNNATADLEGLSDTDAFDLTLPPVRGLHSFHDLLKDELRQKGVVYLNVRNGEGKLNNAVNKLLDILTTIPEMVRLD